MTLSNQKSLTYDHLVIATGCHYDHAVVKCGEYIPRLCLYYGFMIYRASKEEGGRVLNVIQKFEDIKSDPVDYAVRLLQHLYIYK